MGGRAQLGQGVRFYLPEGDNYRSVSVEFKEEG